MVEYIVEMLPKQKESVEENECLYTLLKKAMYGCIQASAIWYALIRKFQEDQGCEVSEMDQCVF
jgi:hypothetical protein